MPNHHIDSMWFKSFFFFFIFIFILYSSPKERRNWASLCVCVFFFSLLMYHYCDLVATVTNASFHPTHNHNATVNENDWKHKIQKEEKKIIHQMEINIQKLVPLGAVYSLHICICMYRIHFCKLMWYERCLWTVLQRKSKVVNRQWEKKSSNYCSRRK